MPLSLMEWWNPRMVGFAGGVLLQISRFSGVADREYAAEGGGQMAEQTVLEADDAGRAVGSQGSCRRDGGLVGCCGREVGGAGHSEQARAAGLLVGIAGVVASERQQRRCAASGRWRNPKDKSQKKKARKIKTGPASVRVGMVVGGGEEGIKTALGKRSEDGRRWSC